MTTQPTTGNPAAERPDSVPADELRMYLRGALIAYGDAARNRIIAGADDYIDRIVLHERRATVERLIDEHRLAGHSEACSVCITALDATASEEEARP